MQVKKRDSGKVRLDLLPAGPLKEIARAMEEGANKYGNWDWLAGTKWSRYYAAAFRHLLAFWSGRNRDPDSGLHPLAHLGCCVLILLEYVRRYPQLDDRPKKRKK